MILAAFIGAWEIIFPGILGSVPLMVGAIIYFVRQQQRVNSKAAQEEVKRR